MNGIERACVCVYFLGFVLNVCLVNCEMRFVCPRPQSPSHVEVNSVRDHYGTRTPCSVSNSSADFYSNYMEVKPGPLTVHLEETVFRAGNPGRISLLKLGSGDYACILLDHIPHNPHVNITTDTSQCSSNDYPLGGCSSSSFLTVNIPDIECDMCVLQFLTADSITPDFPLCSVAEQWTSANCTTNYTCANIKIIPTAAGRGKSLDVCQNYMSNLKGYWPYTESFFYQANLGGSPFAGGFARFILMKKFNIFKYHINLGNVTVLPDRDHINIVMQPDSARMFHIPVTGRDIIGRFFSFDEFPVQILRQGRLDLQLQILNVRQTLQRGIRLVGSRYLPSRYLHPLEGPYSPSGWLSGYDFTGVNAIYTQVSQPIGPCAPRPRQYASTLSDEDGMLRGMVTFGILADLVYIDAIILTRRGSANYISLEEIDGSGEKMIITAEHIDSGFAHATLNFRGQKDPGIVESKLRIGESSYPTLKSTPFKAFKANVTDPNEKFTTLAVIQLLNTGNLSLTVGILNRSPFQRTVEAEVLIKGPQLSSLSGPSRTLTIERTNSPTSAGWSTETTIQINDTYTPHCLLLGILELEVFFPTENITLSTQFSPETSEWLCPDINHPACLRCTISLNGEPVDRGLAEILPNGVASLYLLEQKTLLQYSISVNDLRPEEFINSITLVKGTETLETIPSSSFTAAVYRNRTIIAQGTIRLPTEIPSEPLKLVLSTNLETTGQIFGILPFEYIPEPNVQKSQTKTGNTKPPSNTGNIIQVSTGLSVVSEILILWFGLRKMSTEKCL